MRDTPLELPDGWGVTVPLDRREFLRLTGSGLLVVLAFDSRAASQEPARLPAGRQGYPTDLNAYVHIGRDGRVTCLVGKIEMGQGVMTSLPQLVAEELDVPLDSVDIVMGDTDLCPWDMGTFGSLSIRQFGPVLRTAAAEAKAVLKEWAAETLAVPVGDLVTAHGAVVVAKQPGRRVTYQALVWSAQGANGRIDRKVSQPAVLETPQTFTIVGQSAPRRDGIDKVTGRARYAGDIVPPGAVHARVLRPPSQGAALATVDTSAAAARPGVRVIRDGDLVAVLHPHWDEADRALALVTATWTPAPGTPDDRTIFDHIEQAAPPAAVVGERGILADGEARASRVFAERYLNGYVAHAPIEPHAAVAAVEQGKVTVWASTQTPFPLKTQVAQALKIPPERVRVITPFVGGGFGGKSAGRQAIEAARLAQLAGTPVRVLWDRAEEFFYDTYRPAAVITIRSGLDAAGAVTFWDYLGVGAGERGAAHFYSFPASRTRVRGGWNVNTPGMHPFAIGPWRAPGGPTNAFARECHVDVMARAAGQDPVAFRLAHLADARMTRVLEAAAARFRWAPSSAPNRPGIGVALGIDAGTYVALMVEAMVDRPTGAVTVTRVVCAQDMGVVVNPDGARQQIEGCLMMGLGYTLSEELAFREGRILNGSFSRYELPRFSWRPAVESVILDSKDVPAQGGGEPAIVPLGAAVANAVADATGVRLRQMPFTPARVRAGLAAGAATP